MVKEGTTVGKGASLNPVMLVVSLQLHELDSNRKHNTVIRCT